VAVLWTLLEVTTDVTVRSEILADVKVETEIVVEVPVRALVASNWLASFRKRFKT
jgi:hypothetical protein